MRFEIYSSTRGWVDVMPYFEYHGIEGSREDIEGPNSGKVIGNALLYRDRLAAKYKWNFTTIPLNNADAKLIEELLTPEYFRVRTDYFASSLTTYEVYTDSVTKTYVMYKGFDRVKLTFPIYER